MELLKSASPRNASHNILHARPAADVQSDSRPSSFLGFPSPFFSLIFSSALLDV